MKFAILTLTLTVFGLGASAQVSPYVFPDFVKASVLQKNGAAADGTLDYNTISQEMLFLQDGVKTVLDMSNVDTIYLQDKKFVPVSGAICYQKLTETKIPLYVQLINKPLLHGRNPDLAEQANNTITSSQGIVNAKTTSAKYDMKFAEGYTLEPLSVYYFQKGKSFTKIDDLKKVIKLFPDKEAAITAFVKENHTDLKNADDLAKLNIFCNK